MASTRVAKKSGNQYMQVTIEDLEGEFTFSLLGKTFAQYESLISTDSVISVRGRIQMRDEAPNINVFGIDVLETQSEEDFVGKLHVRINNEHANRETLEKLQGIIKEYRGNTEFVITIISGGDARTYSLPQKVKYTSEMIVELKLLLGADCIVLDERLAKLDGSGPIESTDEVSALEVNERTLFNT
jgi:DNA polymerase-3 subunit alpha